MKKIPTQKIPTQKCYAIVNIRSGWGYVPFTVRGVQQRDDRGRFAGCVPVISYIGQAAARFTKLSIAIDKLVPLISKADAVLMYAPKPVWEALEDLPMEQDIQVPIEHVEYIPQGELAIQATPMAKAFRIAMEAFKDSVISRDNENIVLKFKEAA